MALAPGANAVDIYGIRPGQTVEPSPKTAISHSNTYIRIIMSFQLSFPHEPAGDQPAAIEELVKRVNEGKKYQVLEGVTGSGKTLTMAHVIQQVQRPTVVLSPNKTLADQLYGEFKALFPDAAVRYFISDYDYFHPQTYNGRYDRYTDKSASLDPVLSAHRMATVIDLLRRRDVVVVCSISGVFDIGAPQDYRDVTIRLAVGQVVDRDALLARLGQIGFKRGHPSSTPGAVQVCSDCLEILPTYENLAYHIGFRGNEVVQLATYNAQNGGNVVDDLRELSIYPARLKVRPEWKITAGIDSIEKELNQWYEKLKRDAELLTDQRLREVELLKAQRLRTRGEHDIRLMRETGYCNGIEHYDRHLGDRLPGTPPYTLLNFFPNDYLTFVDESHITTHQIKAMHSGNRSQKQGLVDHGSRLPSTKDARPLSREEWEKQVNQVIFVSATPGPYELKKTGGVVVEQVIRPTGLLDPIIQIEPKQNQIQHLVGQIRERKRKDERVLVLTVTQESAKDVKARLDGPDIRCEVLDEEVKPRNRTKILQGFRRGDFDVLIGIALLREGMDLPEVSLVAILDADNKRFSLARNEIALIQIIGRAARHDNGTVILYANKTVTGAMARAVHKTRLRREKQEEYNRRNNITPRSIRDVRPHGG